MERNRYRSWASERSSILWGRLVLLIFPLTLVFLLIAVPSAVKAVRKELRIREQEVLTAHGSLVEGLREEAGQVSLPVLYADHMTDTSRQVVLDELVRTVFRAMGEDGAVLNEAGETIVSSGTIPVPELPEKQGETVAQLVFLDGNDVQKRKTEDTDRILYTAVTPVRLESRTYWLLTGQDVRHAYEGAERVTARCRLIFLLLLAAVAAGGLAGTIVFFVRGRGRKRKKDAGKAKRASGRLLLTLAGLICLAVLAGLLIPSLSAAMARSGFRKPQALGSSERPISQEKMAVLPDREEMIRTLTTRGYTDEEFHISPYISTVDGDGDGVDDQTDLLESALAYVAKKPVYLSEYYMTGYPTGNCGVCTDVIAFGFVGAGYDLMSMVWEDVLMNPAYYPNSTDENIDFRRVENDLSYFSRNAAESLTTDVYDIDAWKPGDIVVFEKHIGFIANVRNYKGVPYLLHHGYEGQTEYVEDHLEESQDLIVAHFRWR